MSNADARLNAQVDPSQLVTKSAFFVTNSVLTLICRPLGALTSPADSNRANSRSEGLNWDESKGQKHNAGRHTPEGGARCVYLVFLPLTSLYRLPFVMPSDKAAP